MKNAQPGLRNCFRLFQALQQRRAQQELARQFGIFRRAPQFVVVALAHGRIALLQQPLVPDRLRLRMLDGDLTALLYLQGYAREEFMESAPSGK